MPTRRIRKNKVDPADKLAREIGLPEIQIGRGDYVTKDVANHDDNDQRAMVRKRAAEPDRDTKASRSDKGRQTVRRLTRIERLVKLGIIDRDQAAACQWYADAHEFGFVASLGCTANYGGAGGGGCTAYDLLARHKAQQEARDNYAFAKSAIPVDLLALFEQTILGHLGENEFRAVTRNEQFRIGLAAWRLYGQVSHLIAVAT